VEKSGILTHSLAEIRTAPRRDCDGGRFSLGCGVGGGLGLAVLRGRSFANRVRRRLLMLVMKFVRLERDALVRRQQGLRARVPQLGGQNFDRCRLLL
jgi:hypothetical protein